MIKKFMAMLLVIVMVIGIVPMAAGATGTCNHNAEDENNTLDNVGNCTVCEKHICVFGIDVAGKEPTCTEKGVQAHKKCVYNCGKTEGYAEIDVIEHDLDNNGICSMCKQHICVFGTDVAGKEPTCTEKGVKAHKKCSYNCGATQGYEEIDVIEHDLDNDGICSMCEKHFCVFGTNVMGKEPTCTEDGVKPHKKCSYNCGATLGYEVIPALKHKMALVDTKNPTYLADGYKVYACANGCGETYTEVLAKLVPASTDGYDYVPRTGSVFVEWLYALIFG